MTTRWLRGFALACSLLASGCSWAFMTKPVEPVPVPNYPVDCTSSKAAPVLDVICSGYFVANAAVLLSLPSCENAALGEACYSSGAKTGGALLSAGLAVLCGFSAGSGFGYANRCEAIKTQNALCIVGNEASCKQLNPAWTPKGIAPAAAPAPAPAPVPVPAPAPAPASPPTGALQPGNPLALSDAWLAATYGPATR